MGQFVTPTDATPGTIVRSFLAAVSAGDVDAATSLIHDDLVWKNTGLPTIRGGRRIAGMLREMARRGITCELQIHHLGATAGNVVLTDRTDVIRLGRWSTSFPVQGTFEVSNGQVVLWDDHYAMGSVLLGSLRGLRGLMDR